MRKGFALLVLLFSTAMPAVKAYDVDVYRKTWRQFRATSCTAWASICVCALTR